MYYLYLVFKVFETSVYRGFALVRLWRIQKKRKRIKNDNNRQTNTSHKHAPILQKQHAKDVKVAPIWELCVIAADLFSERIIPFDKKLCDF